ncbi:MAG: hypothetical protein IKX21_07495 [Deltaproteobacteria bacterium]|nr:hypothetical protein [Deltaproteobacteria bacterium]
MTQKRSARDRKREDQEAFTTVSSGDKFHSIFVHPLSAPIHFGGVYVIITNAFYAYLFKTQKKEERPRKTGRVSVFRPVDRARFERFGGPSSAKA